MQIENISSDTVTETQKKTGLILTKQKINDDHKKFLPTRAFVKLLKFHPESYNNYRKLTLIWMSCVVPFDQAKMNNLIDIEKEREKYSVIGSNLCAPCIMRFYIPTNVCLIVRSIQ